MIKGMRKALLQSKEIQSEAAITLLVLVNGCECGHLLTGCETAMSSFTTTDTSGQSSGYNTVNRPVNFGFFYENKPSHSRQ